LAGRLILEKVPLFVLAAISCVATVWAQRSGGAVATVADYPLGVRLANAAVAYFAYLWKMIWPSNLTMLYLHPGRTLPVWSVVLSALGLVGITIVAIRALRKRPYVSVGWLWYLITLVPVIGLVQVGKQAMADRYTYIPLIGIFIIIAWGALDLLGLREDRPSRGRSIALGVVGCAIVAALAVAAYPVVGVWRNSITLFQQALKVDPTNSLAYNNIGNTLLEQGDADGAVEYMRKALKYHPEYTDAQYNLANAFYAQGKIPESIAQYKVVIRGCPRYPRAHNNLGSIYALQGKYDQAIAEFEAALKIDPASESTRRNLERARQAKEGGM
jgi:tetratricopeptide (TPR) repeat protein